MEQNFHLGFLILKFKHYLEGINDHIKGVFMILSMGFRPAIKEHM